MSSMHTARDGEGIATATTPMTASDEMRRFGGGMVGPFGELLVVGLVVTALSLPLVTAVPALAAGTHHLRRHLSARSDTVGELVAAAWSAIRSGWWAGLCVAALIGLLTLNVSLGVQGLVPGGGPLAIVSAFLGVTVAVVASRAASLWHPGASWGQLLRQARELTLTDPVGSLYILTGLGVSAVVAWMFLPLIIITPGMIAITLVAAEQRLSDRVPR